MKPVQKLVFAQIVAALGLIAALSVGQTATFPVPTTLPAGSAITVTVLQTPTVAPAPPAAQPSPTTAVSGTLPNGASMPGPTNTGPVAGTVLTPSNSINVTTAGAVIQNLAIDGTVTVSAPNVTVKNCTFNFPASLENGFGVMVNSGADNFILENSSLTGGGPGTCQICQNANNAQYISLHVYDTPKTVFYLSGSAAIKGCWLERIGWNGMGVKSNPGKPNFTGTDHVDGIYFETGSSLVATGNNFDTRGNPTLINGVTYNVAMRPHLHLAIRAR